MGPTKIDPLSVVPLFLKVVFRDSVLSTASGFSYRHEDRLYLITAWHVASGRRPETGQAINLHTGAVPDCLKVFFHVEGKLGQWCLVDVPIADSDGQPIWYQHPTLGQRVDVAAIPLFCPSGPMTYPINNAELTNDMPVSIGRDLFVLGYPLGIRAGGVMPIWKRASIASEPQLNLDGLPLFLVDTATYSGMSGAPVIARQWGQYETADGSMHFAPGSTVTNFMGVYSGRAIGPNADVSQLGYVWKANVLDQIIGGRTIGAPQVL